MYKNQKEIHDFISYDELYILKHDLILTWIILTAYLVQHLIKIGYFKKIKIKNIGEAMLIQSMSNRTSGNTIVYLIEHVN